MELMSHSEQRVVFRQEDVSWLPPGGYIQLIESSHLAPLDSITSVHVFCFREGELLLVRHPTRGWDIPGGHIEIGESVIEALERELLEEAGVTASNPDLIGYLEVNVPGMKPENYRYPFPNSYLPFFIAEAEEILEFKGEFETRERRFFTSDEVYGSDWFARNRELYQLASRHYTSMKTRS